MNKDPDLTNSRKSENKKSNKQPNEPKPSTDDQNSYLDNLESYNPNLTPIELLNNIKGFKHKIELKKYKKKIKEELASYFKSTLNSLEELHDE